MAFGDDDVQVQRDPIPASLLATVAGVDGVAATEPLLQRYAQIVDPHGEVVKTQGAPTLGVAWTGNEDLVGPRDQGRAPPPSGTDQVAIDKATADREDIAVGDQIQVITDTGTYPFTITALVGLGDSDGFAGATLAAWDVATAPTGHSARDDQFDGIDVQIADGADPATVTTAIEAVLPPGTEVVDPRRIIEESKAGPRPDHQRLRQRAAGLRLRHGVRQRLPHQQRVPDHDRPTAAGAGADAGRRRQRHARCGG